MSISSKQAISELAQEAMIAHAPHMQGLNAAQLDAVEHLEGPLLVLAGAGTGKTRVLTSRLTHILAKRKAYPGQILAVTFTNKAAQEMKQRVSTMVGAAVEGMPWLGTFHAISTKMLRQHAELVDLHPNFTILDTDDQLRLLKQVMSAANINSKYWPVRKLAGMIDTWKNKALTPQHVSKAIAGDFADGKAVTLYEAYQKRLKELNACDFGDLLLECISLFTQHPEVLTSYHQKFRYLMVDEYQDTNVAQYLWLRLLAQGTQNLCCVGDDDQSIYGWRGAEVGNILGFEKDFPNAKIIRLEENYRSSGHVLAVASHFISHNQGRLGKTLFTGKDAGHAVELTGAWDSLEEARQIAEEIESRHMKGENLKEMAILVRASFQMREFEDRFVTMGIPYRVIGGPRFYERQEVRDALAYFRMVVLESDDLAFERIINQPKRGLGDASLQKLHAYARRNGMCLMAAARTLVETDEFTTRPRSSLRHFINLVDAWRRKMAEVPHSELAQIILDESGYTAMWKAESTPDAPGRLENLKELVRSMEEFDSLEAFLEHVSLIMDISQDNGEDKVNVMTMHAAKGLEFDHVFLPGWEEGLFPHQRALDEGGNTALEEERRLGYVALTRARKLLRIAFAANRRQHGLWQVSTPSRFLDELPREHIEILQQGYSMPGGGLSEPQGNLKGSSTGRSARFETPGYIRMQSHRGKGNFGGYSGATTIVDAEFSPVQAKKTVDSSSNAGLAVGDRIFHDKFGYGQITHVDGDKLFIDFEKSTPKKVLSAFVRPA